MILPLVPRVENRISLPETMKLILIRHGETIEYKARIVQGQSTGTLTVDGIEQAKSAAHQLKKEAIESIYSSDLNVRLKQQLS